VSLTGSVHDEVCWPSKDLSNEEVVADHDWGVFQSLLQLALPELGDTVISRQRCPENYIV
jgi:hypothetical protein